MAKKITRTVRVYQTAGVNGGIKNHLTMGTAMEDIKNGATYLGEKNFLQSMDIDTWNANCEMTEKEEQ